MCSHGDGLAIFCELTAKVTHFSISMEFPGLEKFCDWIPEIVNPWQMWQSWDSHECETVAFTNWKFNVLENSSWPQLFKWAEIFLHHKCFKPKLLQAPLNKRLPRQDPPSAQCSMPYPFFENCVLWKGKKSRWKY